MPQIGVAVGNEGYARKETGLLQAALGCRQCAFLYVKGMNPAAFAYTLGEQQRIVPVSGGGIQRTVSGLQRGPQQIVRKGKDAGQMLQAVA